MTNFVRKTQSDKIIVKGVCLQKETEKTSASIFPGYLVELTSSGTVQAQSSAGADCRRAVATENSIVGGTIRTEYADEDNVFIALCPTGVEAQLRVAAATPPIAVGDALQAAGDGTVQKQVDDGTTIAFALEAVDNESGTEEAFILTEIK